MYGEIFRKIDNLIFSTDLGKYIELGDKNDYVNGKKLSVSYLLLLLIGRVI